MRTLSKKIFLIRSNKTKFGGAEIYLSRLSKVLDDNDVDYQIVNSIFPKFLPSWLRIILFNLQVCLTKKNKFYFSLERIVFPDVYHAGDGTHKVFLSIENKSKLYLLHSIYLYLERRCFNNAKRIIAYSNIVKDEIINTYDINPKNSEFFAKEAIEALDDKSLNAQTVKDFAKGYTWKSRADRFVQFIL